MSAPTPSESTALPPDPNQQSLPSDPPQPAQPQAPAAPQSQDIQSSRPPAQNEPPKLLEKPRNVEDVGVGEDNDLNNVIRILLESSGFEVKDPEIVPIVEKALRQKLDVILANTKFFAGVQENGNIPELRLAQLKPALNEENIAIDRPEFVLEQPNSKMTTRRTKIAK